jgi:hypothetical protein
MVSGPDVLSWSPLPLTRSHCPQPIPFPLDFPAFVLEFRHSSQSGCVPRAPRRTSAPLQIQQQQTKNERKEKASTRQRIPGRSAPPWRSELSPAAQPHPKQERASTGSVNRPPRPSSRASTRRNPPRQNDLAASSTKNLNRSPFFNRKTSHEKISTLSASPLDHELFGSGRHLRPAVRLRRRWRRVRGSAYGAPCGAPCGGREL